MIAINPNPILDRLILFLIPKVAALPNKTWHVNSLGQIKDQNNKSALVALCQTTPQFQIVIDPKTNSYEQVVNMVRFLLADFNEEVADSDCTALATYFPEYPKDQHYQQLHDALIK